MRNILIAAALAAAATAACTPEPKEASPAEVAATPELAAPQEVVDSLIAADRAFAEASEKTDLVSGLAAMFDADLVMPLPGGQFAMGPAAAAEAMRANPANTGAKAEWTPVRGGVSADGQQGFTFGFMTTTRASGEVQPGKYLAYWIRRPEGWRVAAYKRVGREPGDVSLDLMAPSLPEKIVPVAADPAAVEAHKASLIAAEKAFSDRAQVAGVGEAFRENGREDAMNIYGGAGFTLGVEAVSAGAGQGRTGPAAINWSSDGALVASSGDLGVSWGRIRSNTEPGPGNSFFTIWKRDPGQPWRYIAE